MNEAVADEILKGTMWDLQTDPIKTLRPGIDFHDGTLYMTFPAPRKVIIPPKKKGGPTTEEIQMQLMWVSSDNEMGWFEQESLPEGFTMPRNKPLVPENIRWPIDEILTWVREPDKLEKVEPGQLFTDLRAIFTNHVEYGDHFYESLLPLYIMGSYVYRLFPSIGYLHFNGTMASGKSQNLKILKALGFNCIWASNISTPGLFRGADATPGLICLDEAESFEGERGEELRRLLNAGYKAGEPAIRVEKNGDAGFETKAYDAFTPKALASINPLEPVIQSRCVIIPMTPALRTLPEFIGDRPNVIELRNSMYRWAMQNASTLADLYYEWNSPDGLRHTEAAGLINRAWEISQLFVVLAHHVAGIEFAREVIQFFIVNFAEQQKASEELDRQRLLLKALPKVLRYGENWNPKEPDYLRIKDIHTAVTELLDEDQKEYYRTKTASKHLTALGFRGRKTAKGGQLALVTEDAIREQFRKRRVEPFPEDVEWLEGKVSYIEQRKEAVAATAPAETSIWGDTDG